MEKNNRYFLMIIGSSKNIDEDLLNVADSEHGVNFVDGSGLYMATFYSHYDLDEVYNFLAHRSAYMVFDIEDIKKYGINLPSKYYKGLFPEIDSILPDVKTILEEDKEYNESKEDSLTNVNDILDKLSNNNFDKSCLTEIELKILNEYSN